MKALYVHPPVPRIFESFDAVRREHEVEIERTILQLNKVFPPFDFGA